MDGSLQQVSLTDIGDTIGTPPAQRLKESVERVGVIQPVILSKETDESGEISLAIVDGNRRIAAARAAGLDTVPAVVFEGLDPNTIAQTTLATNGFRSANYLAEYWALKHLERNQYSYDDLVAASGMASSTIKHRRSLSGLNRELFVALRNGQINQAEAVAAARLPRHQQEELAEKFRKNNKLTRKDLQAYTTPAEDNIPPGEEIADRLSQIVRDAAKLGYNKAEFLEMAARIWDETINQQSEQQFMRNQTPKEPFPDLAAHKWDTGES